MGLPMHVPKIAVVTPVKNGEKYLAQAIDSVLMQTLHSWEYVVVDGNSNDNSYEIAGEYASNDNRITAFSSKDKGMYDAIFKGFSATTAPICCWLNCDDKLMPWAFELVLKYVAHTGADWVTGIPARWDAAGLLHSVRVPKWHPRLLICHGFFHRKCLGFIQQESTFFSRQLLQNLDETVVDTIRNQKLAGDFLLWANFAKYASLHTLPSVIAGFRVHSDNATKDIEKYYDEISKAGYQILPAFLGKAMKTLFIPFSVIVGQMALLRWNKYTAVHYCPDNNGG
jgi:glycosyltransferase involved in cell wall biosynthesis